MNYLLIELFEFKDIESDIIGKSDITSMNVISENKSLLEQLLIDIPADSDSKKSAVSTRSTRSHRYFKLKTKFLFFYFVLLIKNLMLIEQIREYLYL